MSEEASAATTGGALQSRSCLACHRRKVRCDRQQPCGNCTKFFDHCTFPSRPITRKRFRRNQIASAPAKHEPEDREYPPDHGHEPAGEKGAPVRSAGKGSSGAGEKAVSAQSAHSGFKDGALYAAGLAFSTSANALVRLPSSIYPSVAARGQRCPNCSSELPESFRWRPSTIQLEACWHIFVENVDPIVHIVHRQSTRKLVDRALQEGLESLDRPSAVLMLVVCHSAIVSMSGWRCEALFNQGHQAMMRKSALAADAAFQDAGLLSTHELTTLQAFVLYLFCKGRENCRSIWTLVAVAVRIAISLSLHKDGSGLGLSPFQVEIRRRVWWQLVMLDVRSAEDYSSGSGVMFMLRESNTKMPTNLNDSDLDPLATEPPLPRVGVTDCTFLRLRCFLSCILTGRADLVGLDFRDMNKAATKLWQIPSGAADKAFRLIESEFFVWFNKEPSSPICRLGMEVGQMIFIKFRLQSSLNALQEDADDPNPTTAAQRKCLVDSLFESAIELLEGHNRLTQDPVFVPYRWMLEFHVQWQATMFVLSQLSFRLEAIARASQISSDEEVRIHLEMLPSMLRRAFGASEGMIEEIQRSEASRPSEKWQLLQRIRRMVRRRIAESEQDLLSSMSLELDDTELLEIDWEAMCQDGVLLNHDELGDFDQF